MSIPNPASDFSSETIWIVVMGVAGCGKSTVGRLLADELELVFIEGDQFHPPENLHKMSEGIALDDADRQGWLDRLGAELQSHARGAVLSCSALKRDYRDRLRQLVPELRFIHLSVTQDLANTRVLARSAEHLFPPSLVASQFAALEDPRGESRVLQLDGALPQSQLSAQANEWIFAYHLRTSAPKISEDKLMKIHVPKIEGLVEKLMAVALTLIVLLIFSNVVGRYLFGTSFAGAEELSRLLFVWLVFLGAILALRRRAHLGVELVQARLPRWARKSCAVVTHLLTLYALWLFLDGSWTQTQIGLHVYSTVLHYPNALVASAGMVCSASMMLIVANNLLRIVTNHPEASMPGDPPRAPSDTPAEPAHSTGVAQ